MKILNSPWGVTARQSHPWSADKIGISIALYATKDVGKGTGLDLAIAGASSWSVMAARS